MSPEGLRELKKVRTREAIVRAALDLFEERGFEATTVADIAEAVEIAPRTFFGYFASKEDVVFHDFEELMEAFEERMRMREPGEDALTAMRAWILEHHAEDAANHDKACRRRLVRESAALEARNRTNAARFEGVLTAAIADDLGVAPDSLRASLAGAVVVAALEGLGRWADEAPTSKAAADGTAVLDEAITFLRGGLDALRQG